MVWYKIINLAFYDFFLSLITVVCWDACEVQYNVSVRVVLKHAHYSAIFRATVSGFLFLALGKRGLLFPNIA